MGDVMNGEQLIQWSKQRPKLGQHVSLKPGNIVLWPRLLMSKYGWGKLARLCAVPPPIGNCLATVQAIAKSNTVILVGVSSWFENSGQAYGSPPSIPECIDQ